MIVAIIQARFSSSRLPGKVLLPLAGKTVLERTVERVRLAQHVKNVILATSVEHEDDAIAELCRKRGIDHFRGSQNDVLARFFNAATAFKADVIVRITCDNPLNDPSIIDEVIEAFQKEKCDYISNTVPGERTFPRGIEVEVFSFDALKNAHESATEPYEREHVTPFIHENRLGLFRIGTTVRAKGLFAHPNIRLALDYPEDYELISKLYEKFSKDGGAVSTTEILQYLLRHPDLVAINNAREKEYPRRGIRK